jgi:hypothetical protein
MIFANNGDLNISYFLRPVYDLQIIRIKWSSYIWGDDSPTHLFDLRFNTFNEINIQVEWEGLQ